MKFSVTKEKLLECLQQVQNVVSTRTTLPILSNVLLQTNGNEVRLTTTDLDVGVRGGFEAQVEKEGATTLPARRLFNIIRELPSSEISFDIDGKNAASIRSGQSFFKILGLPEEEFPPLPKFDDSKVVTIRQRTCATACAKPPTRFRPTKRVTSSTGFFSASKTTSSLWSQPTVAGLRW